LQEEIDNRAIALTVKTTKLTAKALYKAFAAVIRKIRKAHKEAQTPQGRQTVKKLMKHGVSTSTIPLNGDTQLFDRVARKWNVDYSFHKTGRNKYLLLFKSGQADAITAALSEYTKRYMKRAKDKRPPILEQLKKHGEQAKSKSHEHERKREAVHDDR